MSLWRQVTRGFYGLLNRTEQDRGIDDEVRHYFEEATAAYRERGLSEKMHAGQRAGSWETRTRPKSRCARMDGRTRSEHFCSICASQLDNCAGIWVSLPSAFSLLRSALAPAQQSSAPSIRFFSNRSRNLIPAAF